MMMALWELHLHDLMRALGYILATVALMAVVGLGYVMVRVYELCKTCLWTE